MAWNGKLRWWPEVLLCISLIWLAYVVVRCRAALALRTKAEQTRDMAKKRTKSDKAQRQAEGLEKKLERRPAQVPKKKAA